MKKVFSLIILLCLFSCGYIIDNEIREETQGNYISPYRGKWVGTYNGEETGSLTITVLKNGDTEVVRNPYNGSNSETFQFGTVLDNGAFQNVNSLTTGFSLYGNLQTKSGTWKMGDWNGNWSVTKQ